MSWMKLPKEVTLSTAHAAIFFLMTVVLECLVFGIFVMCLDPGIFYDVMGKRRPLNPLQLQALDFERYPVPPDYVMKQ